MDKSPDAFRTISEVAEHLQTPAHVLRFWESRFPQIRPVKRAGGRRYYRPSDVALLAGIRRLLHDEGLTIRGVQKILREQGVRHVSGLSDEEMEAADAAADTVDAAALPAAEVVWLHGTADDSPPVDDAMLADEGLDAAPEAISDADLMATDLPADPAPAEEAGPAAMDAPDDAAPAAPADPDLPGETDPEPAVQAAEPASAEAENEAGPAAPPPAVAPPLPPDDLPLFATKAPPAAAIDPEPHADLPTLAARLRALSPGALADRQDQIGPLFDRLAGLRNRLAERGRGLRR